MTGYLTIVNILNIAYAKADLKLVSNKKNQLNTEEKLFYLAF